MSPAIAAGRATAPATKGVKDGGVIIMVARPNSTAGEATQIVTHSG